MTGGLASVAGNEEQIFGAVTAVEGGLEQTVDYRHCFGRPAIRILV